MPALEALLRSPHRVVAVYTQPDRPAGRGQQVAASAVKQCALRHGVPIEQPATLKDAVAIDRLKQESADLMVRWLAAFDAGTPAESQAAMDLAEEHRQQIGKFFYNCTFEIHVGLAEMYLADPRFTKNYEDQRAGLAQYVHDAIMANAVARS